MLLMVIAIICIGLVVGATAFPRSFSDRLGSTKDSPALWIDFVLIGGGLGSAWLGARALKWESRSATAS
jgi:hypothetical protein